MSAPVEYKGIPIKEMSREQVDAAFAEVLEELTNEQLDLVIAEIGRIVAERTPSKSALELNEDAGTAA